MTDKVYAMESLEELGERIKQARLRKGWTIAKAIAETGMARDTWAKIEDGKSVNDANRMKAMEAVGLGVVAEESTTDNLGPRLNGIERQLADLWRRVDNLTLGIEQLMERGERR